MRAVGERLPRPDALDKVRGTARYVDDLAFAGMLYCRVVRSPHAHARIRGVNVLGAKALPGVHAVLTAADIPGKNLIPLVHQDQPMLAAQEVNHIGEGVVLIAAETQEAAEHAAAAVEIDYEPLPPVLTMEEAFAKQQIFTHWKIRRGDVDSAFRKAHLIVESTFETPYQEHAYLETNGMVALPDGAGGIIVHGSLQCPFYVRSAVATVLGLDLSAVRVVQAVTGGGFGGKEDMPSVPAAMAALLALKTQRPVKYILSREEDMHSMSKRHPALIHYKSAVAKDGTLLGVEIEFFYDGGAYATLSPIVLFRGTVHCVGPYRCPNVKVDAYALRTNKVPCGAFRGFGEPQVAFAHESQMDILAEKLGMDPLEFRLRNALQLGDETATGHKLTASVGLKETMEKVAAAAQWKEKRAQYGQAQGAVRRGIGFSAIYYGVGLGALGKHLNPAGASVVVSPDGSVTVAVGTTEMGQGMIAVLTQIAAEALGCPVEKVHLLEPDTSRVPDSGPTVASRTTMMSGNAIRDACEKIRAAMDAVVPASEEIPFEERVRRCVQNQVHLAAHGWAVPPKLTFDTETGQGEPYITYSWSANVAEVEVDTTTGQVRVRRFVSGHEIGKAVNPTTGEGQIEGGVVQAIGYALVEEHLLHEGKILNDQFSTYIIPTSMDAPEIVPIIVEKAYPYGPYGAKGLGETPMIGGAPAITNALAHALGIRFYQIPVTPERVWKAWREKHEH